MIADDALDVCPSAGTLVYPGYLSWVILKGYLGGYLAYVRMWMFHVQNHIDFPSMV
jgi:hypothetical protein